MSTHSTESLRPIPLEVTVYGPYNALKAANFGAKRLLLCRKGSARAGGLTPEVEELEYLRDKVHIPISCVIRPRTAPEVSSSGESHEYIYSEDEVIDMCESIRKLKEAGVMNPLRGDSFVFGCLRRYHEGKNAVSRRRIVLDESQCHRLVHVAKPYGSVFNRAFDDFAERGNWKEIISQLSDIGFTGVMTAGGLGRFNRHVERLAAMCHHLHDIQLIVAGGFRCPEINKLRMYAHDYNIRTVWINGECLHPREYIDPETTEMNSVMGMIDLLGLQTTD